MMSSCRMDNSAGPNTGAPQHGIMNSKEKEKYIEEYDFPYCDEASKYVKITKIGQGTFG